MITLKVGRFGFLSWCKDGERHRDDDLPAVIWEDGSLLWYQNGKIHRGDDKPAVIWAHGVKEWYKHGKIYIPTGQQ